MPGFVGALVGRSNPRVEFYGAAHRFRALFGCFHRAIYLSCFTMILMLAYPCPPYQYLCIRHLYPLVWWLLGRGRPNDRAPLVTL